MPEEELEFNFLWRLLQTALATDQCPGFVAELCLKFIDHSVKASPALVTKAVQQKAAELIESVHLKQLILFISVFQLEDSYNDSYLINKINTLLQGLEYKSATMLILQKQFFSLELDYLSLFH